MVVSDPTAPSAPSTMAVVPTTLGQMVRSLAGLGGPIAPGTVGGAAGRGAGGCGSDMATLEARGRHARGGHSRLRGGAMVTAPPRPAKTPCQAPAATIAGTMETGRTRTAEPIWDETRLRDPHAQADKAARVQAMFDEIAPTYERVNHVVSLGRDSAWRRRTVLAADVRDGDVILDLCCGTGDMLREFARGPARPGRLIGLDFAARMLAAGHYEGVSPQPRLIRADALRLPLADASVDVASCAFGVRNFQDLHGGLRELRRVLRRGGRAVILEFAAPESAPLRWACLAYCNHVLPRLASWLSRDRSGAYRYLPSSIRTFERRGAMVAALRAAGFDDVRTWTMNLGSVVLYRAA